MNFIIGFSISEFQFQTNQFKKRYTKRQPKLMDWRFYIFKKVE